MRCTHTIWEYKWIRLSEDEKIRPDELVSRKWSSNNHINKQIINLTTSTYRYCVYFLFVPRQNNFRLCSSSSPPFAWLINNSNYLFQWISNVQFITLITSFLTSLKILIWITATALVFQVVIIQNNTSNMRASSGHFFRVINFNFVE